MEDVDPVEHHYKLRPITDFLETNQRTEAVAGAREYLHSGPFSKNLTLFADLDETKRVNELLLFAYAAGETTYVAMKSMILLWVNDSQKFQTRLEEEGIQHFISTNLRADPPLGIATRYCKVNTEIDAMSFSKGDLVHVDIVSSNRQCQMSGEQRQDFTFGSGRHSCPGHLLARAELDAVAAYLKTLDSNAYRIEGDLGCERPTNFRDPGKISIRSVLSPA